MPIERLMEPGMSRPLVVSIPHNLGKEEALRRIHGGIGRVKTSFAAHLTVIDETWTGDRLDFKVTVLRQAVSGAMEVGAQQVLLTVELPWALAIMAEKAKELISRQGTLLLEKK